MTEVMPVSFEPMLLEKVWGGDRLSRFGKAVAAGARVGESWEVADLRTTSASGAGGGAKQSIVRDGPMAGKTLGDLVELWGDDLVGQQQLTRDGGFPLLVKLLDAREHLSVQVHPSPAYAREHPGAHLKTECWYVLDAEPGAVLYKGFKPGVSPADYERVLNDGGDVAELLMTVPAVAGEMHDLPSGTIHALGAGVLVAEVQTPSDTTYRVHDWRELYDRPEREMHLQQALGSTLFETPPAPRTAGEDGELVSNSFYRVREVAGHCEQRSLEVAGCCVVMCVGGMGMSVAADGGREIELRSGQCILVPAALAEATVLRLGPSARCLVAEVV